MNMGPTSHICPKLLNIYPSASPNASTVMTVPTANSTTDRAKYEYEVQSHCPNVDGSGNNWSICRSLCRKYAFSSTDDMPYTRILSLNWITQRPNNKKLQLQRVIQLQPWIKAQGHHCFGDDADISQELCKLQKKDTTVNIEWQMTVL